MKIKLAPPLLASVFALTLTFGVQAASSYTQTIDEALANKDFGALQDLLNRGPGIVDEVVQALLKSVQKTLHSDPDFAQKNISLAAEYAPQITPPSVPAICADLRRIVEDIPADQTETPLYEAVLSATQSFATAPVVVAAGRPNLCEEAWLKIATLSGDPLLAQTRTHRDPHIIPPPPPVPVSAD